MKLQPTMADSVFIGDKVVDVCGAVGVYCKAMSTGTVPMIEERYPFSRHMECVLCIMGEKRKLLHYTAKKMSINHIVLENNGSTANPANMADELVDHGYSVDVIDFNGSVSDAIRQAGVIYSRDKLAEKRAAQYEKELEEAQSLMPRDLNKKVLVLMGLSHKNYDRSFLMVENSGGDADELVLKPTGCVSVGDNVATGDTVGLGFTVVDSLEGLDVAAPDVIALLGDAYVPQLTLKKMIAADPDLLKVPAFANQAIFVLPDCSSGAPVKIPGAMLRWAEALGA